MKKYKWIILITTIVLCLTGCGVYEKIDLKKATKNIDSLKSTNFDIVTAGNELFLQTELFGNLINLYDYDLEKVGISKSNIAQSEGNYLMNIALPITDDKDNVNSYMIIKPAEEKKEALKQEIETYYQRFQEEYEKKENAIPENIEKLKNKTITEYQGYIIAIVSNDNNKSLSILKEKGYPLIFNMMMALEEEQLEMVGLSKDQIEEFVIKTPLAIVSANTYMIIKPANGKAKEVKEAISKYMKQLENQWSAYLPDQYDLVKNRMETEIGNYLIYIISTDNEAVLQEIKKSVEN